MATYGHEGGGWMNDDQRSAVEWQSKCPHEHFDANVSCNRIVNEEGEEPPVRFNADIRITCRDCGLPFRFVGLPHGVDLNGAAVSADGQEARMCIAPKGEVQTMLDGVTGFTARRSQ